MLCVGTVLLELFTPQLVRLVFPKFSPDQVDLCVHLTRILLPGQIFFYAGGIVSAVLHAERMFLYPALSPALYNVFIIVGGVVGAKYLGIASLAWGALAGAFLGPFLINAIGAAQGGLRYGFSFDWRNPGFREWVRLSIPLMLGVSLVSADDWILRYFASGGAGDISRLNYAKRLFAVPHLDSGTGNRSGLDAVLRLPVGTRQAQALRRHREPDGLSHFCGLVPGIGVDDGRRPSGYRSRVPPRTLHLRRRPGNRNLFLLVRAVAGAVVGASPVRASVLQRRRHAHAHGRQHHHRRALAANLSQLLPPVRRSRAGRLRRISAS